MTGAPTIVTNGDCAAGKLALAAPDAAILPWRDMLHDGPVPEGLPLAELSRLRARWLAREFGRDAKEAEAEFAARDSALAAVPAGGEVALCFEHDLYDQLQLLQVLAELRPRAGELRVALAQADDHLGPQSPDALAALLARRVAVPPAAFAAADRLWSSFRAPTPEALAAGLDDAAAAPGLPWLAPALARLLEELPDAAGLTRTERTALELLAEGDGEDTPAGLFARVGAREEARFLGDWPFFRRIEELAAPPRPPLEGVAGPFPAGGPPAAREAWAQARLRLTAAGRALLAGGRDRLADRPPDRWLGGTRLRPGHVWRWDAAARRLGRDPGG